MLAQPLHLDPLPAHAALRCDDVREAYLGITAAYGALALAWLLAKLAFSVLA